jgi:hypothetical protein
MPDPKHVYSVTVPFAGHMVIEVEAESEEAAIEKAIEEVTSEHIEGWEPLEHFNQGNVCYCPQPWEAEAVDCGPAEDEPEAA